MYSSLEYYEVYFWVSFYGPCFEICFVWYNIVTPAFFPSICLDYFFLALHLQCVGLLFWRGSLVGSICVGHNFLSTWVLYVFWLEHLIHLCLRLLFIDTYSLPFYFFQCCVPLSLTTFLPFLKADPPLPSVPVWLEGGVFFEPSFVWGSPYFTFHFNWEPCCIEWFGCRPLFFIFHGIFLAIPFWLGAFPLRCQLLVLLGLPSMLFYFLFFPCCL